MKLAVLLLTFGIATAANACPPFMTCGNYSGKATSADTKNGHRYNYGDYEINLVQGESANEIIWSAKWLNGSMTMRYVMAFDANGNYTISMNNRNFGTGVCQNMVCKYNYCLAPGASCVYLVTGVVTFAPNEISIAERTQAGPRDQTLTGTFKAL